MISFFQSHLPWFFHFFPVDIAGTAHARILDNEKTYELFDKMSSKIF